MANLTCVCAVYCTWRNLHSLCTISLLHCAKVCLICLIRAFSGTPDVGCCAGIAGLTPESAAALQVLGAAAAASRLGLDSSVASHAAFSGGLPCLASQQECYDGI